MVSNFETQKCNIENLFAMASNLLIIFISVLLYDTNFHFWEHTYQFKWNDCARDVVVLR